MILFVSLLPILRLVGCQHLLYCKYLVSHTQLWTGILSIGEKNSETRGKVHTYLKRKKKKPRKESKVYGMLDAVLEQKNLGLIRTNDQCGLQTVQCDHVRNSGKCRK